VAGRKPRSRPPARTPARRPTAPRRGAPPAPVPPEHARLEARLAELRAEQKRLTGLLADRGAGPEGAGEGLLRAMLQLKGTKA
jgi:hypothetical protein